LIVVVAALFGAGAAAGANYAFRSRHTTARASRHSVAPGPTLAQQRAELARAVSFSPRRDAGGVPPDSPIAISAATGWLSNVQVAPVGGLPIPGALDIKASEWLSRAPLMAATAYRISATVNNFAGLAATVSSTFSTLAPVQSVNASVFPTDGMTVGVGQPIAIRFDHAIDSSLARAALLSHITITESQPLPGAFYWFSPSEVHFRPQTYWPPGEQVTFNMNLNGWNAGDAGWGNGGVLMHFTVGDAHESVANLANDTMVVKDNGRVIASYAISGGRPKYPTMNGTHIVMDRESVVHMVSSTVGIPVHSADGYDEFVYADVHISDSGEYVHAAPWSVRSQGHTNVSHGCINLSNSDAYNFFGFSRIGDIVQVVGGPRPPAVGDHGVMDWDTPWNQWTPAVVQPLHPKPAVVVVRTHLR
jgi:lipoprotein-anchoring transpeptidase ErfK/SrfK